MVRMNKPIRSFCSAKTCSTCERIFDRLRIEQGYAGGYTVVKDYVRIARTRSRDEQTHPILLLGEDMLDARTYF